MLILLNSATKHYTMGHLLKSATMFFRKRLSLNKTKYVCVRYRRYFLFAWWLRGPLWFTSPLHKMNMTSDRSCRMSNLAWAVCHESKFCKNHLSLLCISPKSGQKMLIIIDLLVLAIADDDLVNVVFKEIWTDDSGMQNSH